MNNVSTLAPELPTEQTTNVPPLPILEGQQAELAGPQRPCRVRLAVVFLVSVGVFTGVLAILGCLMILVGSLELLDAARHGRGRADLGTTLVECCAATITAAVVSYRMGVESNRIWRVPSKEPRIEKD